MPVSRLRSAVRLTGFILLTAVLLPVYAFSLGPFRRTRRPIQVFWCRLVCVLCGLNVRVSGTRHDGGATLFVSNHVSYLDIPVLSRLIEATFVAKSEVADWPLFGLIARVTGTVFVDRLGSKARGQRAEIRRRLAGGENLLLFAEGTSTDGTAVAPFKSALMDVAVDSATPANCVVQPVSVAYPRARDGSPLTGARAQHYAWYGDKTLAPHLWQMLGRPGAETEVRFHPPVHPASFADRKSLARHCHAAVASGVAAAHARTYSGWNNRAAE